MKTEAQKTANKRYYDKHKGELATWVQSSKRKRLQRLMKC
jgi:hypothetical protein